MILLSALDRADNLRAGEEAGCDAYLTKPFSPRDLIDHLSDVSLVGGD